MKIQEFERLENKINNQNFHENYKTINNVMIAISYFGHIASIFLAFFMLSKVLFGVMDNKIIVYGSTLVVLSSIELLKRDIFGKFSRSYLKLRSFGKDVLPLFFLSIAIIGISFYSSIKGASEYSSKGDKIDQNYIELNKKYEDSLTKVYQIKIDVIENQYVQAGELLGLGGTTGHSSGPHLHFETRYKDFAIDPEQYYNTETGVLLSKTLVLDKKELNANRYPSGKVKKTKKGKKSKAKKGKYKKRKTNQQY